MTSTDELLNYREAAEMLGISVRSLQRLVSDEAIPVVEMPRGGRRFAKSDLIEWVNRHTAKPRK